jgi:WD40 repeat protein
VAVGKNTDRVYSGSRDYGVKGWDAQTGKCVAEFSAPRNIVTTLEFESSGESILFQGSEDLCVRAWDTKSGSKLPAIHITGYVYFPTSMAVSSNGYHLATGCKGFNGVGCEVKIWDIRKTAKPLSELQGHTHDVTGVKYSKDGSKLVSVSKDGSIILWDSAASGATASSSSAYKKLTGITGTGKYFTSVVMAPHLESSSSTVDFAVSAFDGSISFYRASLSSGADNNTDLVLQGATPIYATGDENT